MENNKQAVVLLNMGGVNSLSEVSVFLKNMFCDPYILPIKSNFIRSMVANFIVNKRLEEAKENYKKIGGKSPLVEHTFKLTKTLESLDSSYFYTYAMRYTPPFAPMVVKELQTKGIEEIVLFSMYPHFSYTTIASSYDDFIKALKSANYNPKITYIKHYYDFEPYNKCIVSSIKNTLKNDNSKEFHLIFSAHSLPQRNIKLGDPYKDEIEKNVEILKEMLRANNLEFASIKIAYQSKIGPIKWLEPNLSDIIPKYKDKKLLIYPISFTIDNSETDYELKIEYKNLAQESELLEYRVADCFNFGEEFAKCILELIRSKV
ncbi:MULTISPECIES: ferrochelatase [Helicobacter]|uniref:Ferrochelatase n=1 Tax=Helicobacter ibis TaxID=2962633 RepID=A0ABT4VEE9_9HELI|nr:MULTISPECIES: ferrochelatase [Helicobacter]MDA3967478.1 ferrochelatase [Helicobacter sp. WB40]MDA3969081.1 ferrochelatase [Helicobacter ibis]